MSFAPTYQNPFSVFPSEHDTQRVLHSERLYIELNAPDAAKKWSHRYQTLYGPLRSVESVKPDRLDLVISHISPSTYKRIVDCNESIETFASRPAFRQLRNKLMGNHEISSHRSL